MEAYVEPGSSTDMMLGLRDSPGLSGIALLCRRTVIGQYKNPRSTITTVFLQRALKNLFVITISTSNAVRLPGQDVPFMSL